MAARRDRSLRALIFGLLVSAVACGKAPGPAIEAEPSLSVTTVSGEVRGVREPGIRVFRGIPYAAPPIGPLRWRPPRPAEAWEGVRIAEDFGMACPQPRALEPMSEDCLSLNIWTPASATFASRLPVMVYVHGGGFRAGSGARP